VKKIFEHPPAKNCGESEREKNGKKTERGIAK